MNVMAFAWTEATCETYGTGLLTYHVFCDKKEIPETQRAPTSSILLQSFVASMAGSYSAAAITNYVCGVRAWHILHGIGWRLNDDETNTLLQAAARIAPESSKRKKRRPYTIDFIAKLKDRLDLRNSLDAAVFACLSTCFYATARVGEFTIRRLTDFNPALHVKRSDLCHVQESGPEWAASS
jgi:hypothetical protein